jgi:hypothetical protein
MFVLLLQFSLLLLLRIIGADVVLMLFVCEW